MLGAQINGKRLHWVIWFFACFLMALASIVVLVSLNPYMPADGLDSSWTLGMSYAVEHNLEIGRDIVFTFGPLANVYSGIYSPKLDTSSLLISIYLAVVFALGVYGVFRDKRSVIPVVVVAFSTVAFGFLKDPFLMLIPVLSCLALARDLNTFPDLSRRQVALVISCLPALGLLPLMKLSFSVLCALCLCINIGIFICARRFVSALACFLIPLGVFVGVWCALGQSLHALPDYIINAKPMISGYAEGMAIAGNTWVPVAFILGGGILCAGLFFLRSSNRSLGWTLLVVVSAYLFVAFKAGFVRDDGHGVISGVALLMISVISLPFLRGSKGVLVACISAAIGVFVIGCNNNISPSLMSARLQGGLLSAYSAVRTRVLSPGFYKAEYSTRLAQVGASSNFPKLQGTTDVYSFGQGPLIASGANWKPRPVFQSYTAYTPELLRMNAAHLKSADGAQNILFAVEPIDGRLPSLEDGMSWPTLFSQYEFRGFSGHYALLQRVHDKSEAPAQLGHHAVKRGESVQVPSFDGQVYMTALIKPTLLGRVRSALYKPTPLMVTLTLSNGQVRTYRIISGMTQTDFLVSPLVENTNDFGYLYGGAEMLAGKRVVSVAVAPLKRKDRTWADIVEIDFSGFKAPASQSFSKVLELAAPITVDRLEQGVCAGVIDTINGMPPVSGLKADHYLSITGWNSDTTSGYPDGAKNVVVFTSDTQSVGAAVKVYDRPDVALYFKSPTMVHSGFASTIDVSGLTGHFKLGLGIERNGVLYKCPNISYDIAL